MNNRFWHDYIDNIVKKVYKRLNVIRKLNLSVDIYTFQRIYMSFIRPILKFGDVICHNQSIIDEVENFQLDAERIVTGATKLTSIDRIYK